VDTADCKFFFRLSGIAYRAQAPALEAVAGLGLRDFQFYDGASTQAFLCGDDTRFALAFRGSERDPLDWIRTAQFHPVPGELGGHVHSGFHGALDEVWDEVAADLAGGDRPLFVTGHSLGGALATLAAARAHAAGSVVGGVYTYGQPRVGKADFQVAYNAALDNVTFRVVNHIDLVTRVPLLVQGYRHIGRRMYFDESGALERDAGNWPVARDDIRYRFRHVGRIQAAGLTPHLLPAYRERIDALS
jgi:triacylglycerol lipase